MYMQPINHGVVEMLEEVRLRVGQECRLTSRIGASRAGPFSIYDFEGL
jgi:hypothetical protein